MKIVFWKGKSGSVNTPVSVHYIQNKTQSHKVKEFAPEYLSSRISLHCPLTQDTSATHAFFLSPEQANLVPMSGPWHLFC